MEFVTPVITAIVQSLMEPIKKHMGFFFSSTKHVTNMRDKLTELNEAKGVMEKKMKDASRNEQFMPDTLPGWLERVEKINAEAKNIQTGGHGCPNLKVRYKAGKRSFNILKKIDDLIEKQGKIEWSDKQRPLGMVGTHAGPSTSETAHYYDVTRNIFPSRLSIFNDVLKSLEHDSGTQMMAICGMGGVGKTTMMEDIMKEVKNRGMFQWVVKVVIGTKYNPIATQKNIAEQTGSALSEDTIDARADRLRNRFEQMLKGGENILVIMDDVWEAINLKDIGLASPIPIGFKLLVTSRIEKACIKMDIETNSIFKMVGLEEQEANSFFWETVRISDEDSERCTIGKDILNRCGGLPIAIKTIALALRSEDVYAWQVAQKSLQRHNLGDIEDLDGVVYNIFYISYEHLKRDEDKAIFVLCGLYPDDFDIPLEELLRYGWGLRLFKSAYTLDEARKRTCASVSNLICANLLTESYTVGCVKMHDLARDFVLKNISKFKQASFVSQGEKSEWPKQDATCERFLLRCQDMTEFPDDFYYPNLALMKLIMSSGYYLYTPCQFPEDFHKRMEKLEVIAYDYMRNPLLLVSLQCSFNLRTLCLHSCSLVDNDISFVGDLVNLEVLSIAYCSIRKLPSTIRQLKMLKLLDLTGCVDLCIDDGVLRCLEKLEELYMRCSYWKPIRFTNANCDELETLSRKLYALDVEFYKNILEPKRISFTKLQKFRISMGCFLKEKFDYTNDIYSSTLKLVTNRSNILECNFSELFSKTEELHLSVKDMNCVEDIAMPLSQHSTFCMLKVLCVFKCVDLTHLFTIPTANGLKQLTSLKVSSCPVLKSLVSLSDRLNLMELPQLVELELNDLPDFTSIFPENYDSTTHPLFNKEVVFPKLSIIKVVGLKKLTHIWACEVSNGEEDNVSKLREIEVIDCDCLVNLFPRNPMRLLSHLEELKVERCSSIEVLFNIDLGKIEQLKCSSKLRRILCDNLEELTEVWRINPENNPDHLICGFQAVETIRINRCKKFRNVFTPAASNFDFGALKDITIKFNSGEELEITGTSKMQEISKDDGNMSIVSFPSYHLNHTFHDLRKICFEGFQGAEVMFDMEYPSINRELVPTLQQQPSPLLPCLEELELSSMDKLNHVWKCNNWNEFFILYKNQPQSSFQNLTTISLSKCKSIKYLFSPLMSKLLSNLKAIYIRFCEGMEEVVSNRDDDDDDQEEVLTTSTTTLFPCLNYIELDSLHNLKRIGGVAKGKTNVTHDQFKFSQVGVVPWSLCQYSTKIQIDKCDALPSVLPFYAAKQMQKLQELHIDSCRSMVEVFETKEINSDDCSSSSTSVDPRSVPLPRSNNSIMHHELTNLKILKIFECDLLEYVFTFSTFESLKKLETLSIGNCKEMKVIVREENGYVTSNVVLPRLKSIELEDLPNLAGFFLGMNINFRLPSLDYVTISKCPKMTVFTSGDSTAPKLEYIHTCLGKYNLECGLNFHQTPSPNSPCSSLCPPTTEGTFLSFHNLIEMDVAFNHELKKIVPFSELLQLQNLRKVSVQWCKNVEEVFEVASEVTNNESQTVVTFPNLKEVELEHIDSLKYIWKSNQWVTLEFPNLTRLRISGCESLEYVFTASMVGSLKQLQKLYIGWCNRMETIVKKEEECDGEVSEIVLPCLKSLTLYDLASLKGFCLGKENFTLPSLNTLEIYECPEIRVFSEGSAIAPELKLVQTNWGLFQTEEDINSFIITNKQEGNIFGEPGITMYIVN